MSRQTAPRILTTVAVLAMVVSGVGFFASLLLNVFVFDEFDAYGEIPIPGSSSLHLPAGDVTVSFHTVLVGSTTGSGLPVPPLKYRIAAPHGVAEPVLTEDYGSTTVVNNDARVRIGYLHVPAAGDYEINTDGTVSAFLDPRLAFGHGTNYGDLPLILGVIFGLAVVGLVIVRVWAARSRRPPPPSVSFGGPAVASFGATPDWTAGDFTPRPMLVQPAESFTPTDEGVRVQSLNTLARLRDSGALTQAEYEAEKKRVLEGP